MYSRAAGCSEQRTQGVDSNRYQVFYGSFFESEGGDGRTDAGTFVVSFKVIP